MSVTEIQFNVSVSSLLVVCVLRMNSCRNCWRSWRMWLPGPCQNRSPVSRITAKLTMKPELPSNQSCLMCKTWITFTVSLCFYWLGELVCSFLFGLSMFFLRFKTRGWERAGDWWLWWGRRGEEWKTSVWASQEVQMEWRDQVCVLSSVCAMHDY